MIKRSDVEAARTRITGRVRHTPLAEVDPGTFAGPTWLKLEYLQHTGTFKARGAFNRILSLRRAGDPRPHRRRRRGLGRQRRTRQRVCRTSTGRARHGVRPTTAPSVKIESLRSHGAAVVLHGTEYAAAYEAAIEHADRNGAVYCHAYDQPEIAAGAGTLGLEPPRAASTTAWTPSSSRSGVVVSWPVSLRPSKAPLA